MPNQIASQPATTDVLIVGGGPAGLAAAIALCQRGIGCTVVEARAPGIDKACGEGLMPDSRDSLAQLGVCLTEDDGQPFHGIRFLNAARHVEANFPHGVGIGVRRIRLHALLAERALQLGAHLLWDSRIQLSRIQLPSAEIESNSYRTVQLNGQPIRFRWLVGADGQSSSVRSWAGLNRVRRQSLRYGLRTHYRVAPSSRFPDYVEVHWARSGQLYVTPVAPDCVCVVYVTRDPHRLHADARANILAEFPAIAQRLRLADVISSPRGSITANCQLHRVATGSVALIGDASGSADAITGEGLALAFRQAITLADAIHSGSLAPYNHAHRQIGKFPIAMGELMLTLDRWPTLQARVICALAAKPALFQELLEAHIGGTSLTSLLLRLGPRFGWSLLTQGAPA